MTSGVFVTSCAVDTSWTLAAWRMNIASLELSARFPSEVQYPWIPVVSVPVPAESPRDPRSHVFPIAVHVIVYPNYNNCNVQAVTEIESCFSIWNHHWSNISGLPGPPGATGETGIIGDTGPQGRRGDTGSPGSTGATGPSGLQGPRGPPGSVGMYIVQKEWTSWVLHYITYHYIESYLKCPKWELLNLH